MKHKFSKTNLLFTSAIFCLLNHLATAMKTANEGADRSHDNVESRE